jgi:hypothetical protein
MKLYLAHPLLHRHRVREIELEIEEETGLDLLNPFYDVERDEVTAIDAGTQDRWFGDPNIIVPRDLGNLKDCDGLLALPCGGGGLGMYMEIVYASTWGKPVYIIEGTELSKHIWLRFHAKKIFPNFTEFIEDYKRGWL